MKQYLTVRDMVDFILLNRGITFMNMDEDCIATQVRDGIKDGTMFYSQDSSGNITGMILARKDDERKVILVMENIALSLSNLRQFAKMAKERFPEYNYEWYKHGNFKAHDSKTLYNKLKV